MESLNKYQHDLINSSLLQVEDIVVNDYSLGRLHRALAELSEELEILPGYKKYAHQQIQIMIDKTRQAGKDFYKKYGRLNPLYTEIALNLSNFK